MFFSKVPFLSEYGIFPFLCFLFRCVFQNSCPWPVLALPGLWGSLTGSHSEETVTVPQPWWARAGVLPWCSGWCRAWTAAAPSSLPTTAVGRPWPPLQTRLGGRGEKWRNLMTAQVCFWIEVQPWSFVFAAAWPSGVNGHWIQKVAWELLECLPGLVVSSAKWNKPNLSNIMFSVSKCYAATIILFSQSVIKYDSASPTVSQPQHNEGHEVEVSLSKQPRCFREVPECLLVP